jgi:hypothetical protein
VGPISRFRARESPTAIHSTIGSAPSEAGHKAEQAFYAGAESQARDNIAGPMREKHNSGEHQTASNCPDGIMRLSDSVSKEPAGIRGVTQFACALKVFPGDLERVLKQLNVWRRTRDTETGAA